METKSSTGEGGSEYQQFGKTVASLLKQFEKTREWADIGNWLAKVQPALAQKKFGNVPHKIRLTKRLAQCLSPGIPSTIHSNALNVYKILLNNYGNKVEMLPLLSIGLFPFFQYCSTALKFQLIDIFEKNYVSTPECLQMITSLVNTLLTSFIQNNEQLNKRVHQLCDKIAQNFGRQWVDGAVWVNILKSPKVRSAGYKYFMKSFKDRDKAKEDANQQGVKKVSDDMRKMQIEDQKQKKEDQKQGQTKVKATKPLTQSQELVAEGRPQKQKSGVGQIKKQLPSLLQIDEKKVRKGSQFIDGDQFFSEEDIEQQTEVQKIIKKRSKQGLGLQTTVSITNDMFLDQMSAELQQKLLEIKNDKDGFKVRFPNFSSLVVNAICESLESPESDNLIRRSALDMMIFYLNQDNKAQIPEKDLVLLISVMLQMINFKQYSLTRRVYTYLFGPPNMEGVYQIQPQKKQYQLKILKLAMEKLLKTEIKQEISIQKYQKNLNAIYVIFNDNEKLQPLLIPQLAYKILKYLRIAKLKQQFIYDFYTDIIQPNSRAFSQGIFDRMMMQSVQKRPPEARQTVLTIQNFYNIKKKMRENGKQAAINKQQINLTIEWLLKYLLNTKCSYERLSIQILQLCTQLLLLLPESQKLNSETVQILNELIKLKPAYSVYSKILNLHPQPQKQDLLPYINETALTIVSIKNLLAIDTQYFSDEEKKQLFMAIFNLYQCRIWQDQAINFTKIYKSKFQKQFLQLIDQISPSQWLIYWNNVNGDVDGGVIRMLQKIQSEDKQNRQQIKKWLQDSKTMPNKIADPVYNYLKQTQNKDIQKIYKMLKRIIKAQRQSFTHLLFKQRQKYLMPLLDRIFDCFQTGDEKLKVQSVEMLQYIIENITSLDQKLIFMSITFKKILEKLKQTQKTEGRSEREAQIIQYFMSMVDSFRAFKGNQQRISILQQIVEGQGFFSTMAQGMKLTTVGYVRTLYIQLLQRAIQMFIYIQAPPNFIAKAVQCISQKLFPMLKQNNVASLEQIISGITQKTRKIQQAQGFVSEQIKVEKSQINVQQKYAQIIQLWNCTSLIFKMCIDNKIHNVPTLQLLNLILQSFPFSFLKFEQISQRFLNQGYINLQDQIKNVTGLKKQVLTIFEILWKNYPIKIADFLIQKGDPRILIHSNIQSKQIMNSILKGSYIKKIQKYYNSEQLKIPKGVLHYNLEMLMYENQLCYFLYLYLIYSNLDSSNSNIQELFEKILTILKLINLSSHSQTQLWILQTLYSLSLKISFKNLFAKNSKLKNQTLSLLHSVLEQITLTISKQKFFTLKSQIKTGFLHKLNKADLQQNAEFDFVRPYPPTISKQEYLYQNQMKNVGQVMKTFHAQDQTKQFLFSKQADLSEPVFRSYISTAGMKTYTSILIPLLQHIYENDHHKIASMCKENAQQMFTAYKSSEENKSRKNNGNGNKETQISDRIYAEVFAQFLRKIILDNSIKSQVIKGLRKNILQAYMSDDFFKCTKNTLNYWKPVIDACTQNHDLIGQLIPKQGLFEGLFSRKNQATQVQIKNFERVCFLIFSGKIDKYQKKLRVVLQSLSKVMKAQNPSPALLILILFCLRILFMRLSQAALNRMFRSIWPSLIALLIQIFAKKRFQKCVNLRLSALKTIQLVHALQLQQFNIHKWIFIFDYFGIKIQAQSQQQQKVALEKSVNVQTPFKYKPILCRILPKKPLKCTFIPSEQGQIAHSCQRRQIIIRQTMVNSEVQLQKLAYSLLQYMVDSNQKRVITVREDIQDLIEADLIELDNFIYDAK